MNILCVDIGGTAIKSGFFVDNQLVKSYENPSQGSKGVDTLIANLFDAIDHYSGYDIISIDSAGQVDSNNGTIIYGCGNIPGYTGTNLAKIVRQKFKKEVLLENDVSAAAIGEATFGAAKGIKDFICLTYGTGIGGAIYIDGKLYKGSTMAAGEFGHFTTHPGGTPCACGQSGCYECYASTTALVKKALALDSTLSDGVKIFKEFKKGNDQIRQLIDDWTDEIVIGLSSLTHIFNPSAIILGGGIFDEAYLTEAVREKLLSRVIPSFANVDVLHAALGSKAALYGMLTIANCYINDMKI